MPKRPNTQAKMRRWHRDQGACTPKRGLGTNQKKCPQPASPQDCNDGDVIIENCDYGTAVSHVCVDGQWQAIEWVCPEAQSPEASFQNILRIDGDKLLTHIAESVPRPKIFYADHSLAS